jgi:hypothetical protein
MVVVRVVSASSRFYQRVLAAERGHGGNRHEQIVSDGEILLLLHAVDVEDHHGRLADPDQPPGNVTSNQSRTRDPDGYLVVLAGPSDYRLREYPW